MSKLLLQHFVNQILPLAHYPQQDHDGHPYNLKRLRATKATEWMELCAEYKVMGWKQFPPNPLQHTSEDTTRKKYASSGADNELKARLRCIEKVNPPHSYPIQPWMKLWFERQERFK